MKYRIATAILVSYWVTQASALNLTPHRILVGGDGPPRERHYFQDASSRVGFSLDKKMSVTGSSDEAIFRFADFPAAVMRLTRSPMQPAVPFAGKDPDSYEKTARKLLPFGATNLQLLETKPNPISINNWTSIQYVYSYQFFGLSYRRVITFLNFNATEQFVFDVSARAPNFTNIYTRSYRVLNSLYELRPDSKTGPS